MKSVLLGLSLATLVSGTAMAAPWGHGSDRVNFRERAAIAQSAANLAQIKRRAWSDGRLSFFERIQIRNAEKRHAALVSRARRS